MERRKIAVVGAGVAGLSSAWLLASRHDVTLFEKQSKVGGHVRTIGVDSDAGPIVIDTGFMVFNHRNYPLLTQLFKHLGVVTQPTDMSFSCSIDNGRLEYAGGSFSTFFAQRERVADKQHWQLLRDILRFNRNAKRDLARGLDSRLSLGEYLKDGEYRDGLAKSYLLPMAAAIWSCPSEQMRAFPAASFLRFFHQHGLLDLVGRPQWHTVSGGSRQYVDRILDGIAALTLCDMPVLGVQRAASGLEVHTEEATPHRFDEVIMACHADETLRLLSDTDNEESSLLGSFGYQTNTALLHTDENLMPQNRRAWASWNYFSGQDDRVSVSYWMNQLQRLPARKNYMVTLNPVVDPAPRSVVDETTFEHPVFDAAAIRAQSQLANIQGNGGLWYCGAWCGFGFHEDGLRSAVEVCRELGCAPPWELNEVSAHSPAFSATAETVAS